MHNNLWLTFYLTLIPAGLVLIIGIARLLTNRKSAKRYLITGIVLLIFPLSFVLGHFASVNKEMKLRAGTYIVTRQENLNLLCKTTRFDSLTLTLDKRGFFTFNYKPCFAGKINGHWKWTDDMVGTHTTFDKIGDGLYLYFPFDDITDTIVLTKYQVNYLTFAKVKTGE